MKTQLLNALLILIPLIGFCQGNDYRENKLNEIVDYQILLGQITHAGPEYIKRQPVISKDPLIDSLDLYSIAIDAFIEKNIKANTRYKNYILFDIILEAKEFDSVLDEKIDNMYMISRAFDKESDGFDNMVFFLTDIGRIGKKHLPSLEYCFQVIRETNFDKNPRSVNAVIAHIYYVKRVYLNDEKVIRKLERILEENKFFNSKELVSMYDLMPQN